MILQRNLLIVSNDIMALHELLAQGYRVLLCTEDQLPADIMMHPNVMKMTVLLPPYEVVSLEIDRQYDSAMNRYVNYLSAYPSAASMCNIIYLAALGGTPLGIYFGREQNDLQFPNWLLTYFQNFIGLQFSTALGCGAINTDMAPTILLNMYLNCELQAMQVLAYYPPNTDLPPQMVDKLMAELLPPVPSGDIQAGNAYFKDLILQMNGQATNQYGQALRCPFTAGNYGGVQR